MSAIYFTNHSISPEKVEKKMDAQKARASHFAVAFTDSKFSLGIGSDAVDSRDYAIPKFDKKWCLLDGAVYNDLELSRELKEKGCHLIGTSHEELIIKGLIFFGLDFIEKLNGDFSFLVFDERENRLLIVRDRLGVKPLCYKWEDGFIEVASIVTPFIDKYSEIDEDAVSIYLDCGYVPSPFTIIKNVKKLSPGNFLLVDFEKKTIEQKEYWNLREPIIEDISYSSAQKKVHDLIENAVDIRMRGIESIGSFLSGGIDSALISAIASKKHKGKLKTFTVGFEDPKYDESKIAAQYASMLGTDHQEIICKPDDLLNMLPWLIEKYDEPFADSSALPSLFLSSVTKKYVDYALTGDGGDESFLGYRNFDLLQQYQRLKLFPLSVRKVLVSIGLTKFLRGRPEVINGIISSKDDKELIWKIFTGFDSLTKTTSSVLRNQYGYSMDIASQSFQNLADLNIKLWLENDSNVKTDRSSNFFSLDLRSAFLDFRIVDFARTLPVSYRYKNNDKKIIIKDILESYLPRELFEQPKRGFAVPMEGWLKHELKSEIEKYVIDERLEMIPNLNLPKFRTKYNLFYENRYNHSTLVWRLFVLIRWLDKNGK